MIPRIDVKQLAFLEPAYLWLLAIPALLLAVWTWRFVARRADVKRLRRSRLLPVRERFALAGDLPFWLCLIAAIGFAIVALARPYGPTQGVRQGGVDIVILADASASMRVKDVAGDRWQRAMRFVRLLGDSLSWKNDRIAMAVFAHIAAPQIRLTRDPNTFFFFLDHLDQTPPFRIEDDTTWDTNLELGVYWGLRVIERDEELHGKSPNAKMFVLLSDGEAWSGEVAKSLQLANRRQIPVFAIGVGSLSGGPLPVVQRPETAIKDPEEPVSSRLERETLEKIASATNGQYFELDRDGDRHIANAIIDAGKRLAPMLSSDQTSDELYWWFLCGAAAFAVLGMLFLRERGELPLPRSQHRVVLFLSRPCCSNEKRWGFLWFIQRVDGVLADLVVQHPLGRVEQPRRLRAVPARRLQRVLNQILLEPGHGVAERHARHRARRLGRLQRGRQMMAVNHLAVAHEHGALERVLELAHVARPVIAHEHVDGRRRDALDALVVLA